MNSRNWSRAWLHACRHKPDEALRLIDEVWRDPRSADTAEFLRRLRTLAKDWRALLRLAPPALAADAVRLRREIGDFRRSLGDLRRDHMVARMYARAARDVPELVLPAGAKAPAAPIEPERCRLLADALVALAARQDDWRLDEDEKKTVPKALRDGVIRAYCRGRRHLRHDIAALPLVAVHDLRTATTDLSYQLAFLTPLWPGPLTALVAEAERLRGRLGRIVDVTEARDALPPDADPRLRDALDREEARRRGQAAHLAALFYADGPKALRRRLTAWFEA